MLGIAGIDRTGTDPSDDNDLGEPVWLQSFDLGDAAVQEHLVWLCDEIEAEVRIRVRVRAMIRVRVRVRVRGRVRVS